MGMEDDLKAVAHDIAKAKDVLYLGRGPCSRWPWKAR
jgi:hypothetical protein